MCKGRSGSWDGKDAGQRELPGQDSGRHKGNGNRWDGNAKDKDGRQKIGIVILNYQTWELSLRCMESIHRICRDLLYRIYLVDNASERPMPDAVKSYVAAGKEIRFLQAKENRGYAAGNNIGIARALADGCDAILISNNDIVF